MNTKVFIAMIGVVAVALAGVAFVPGVHSRIFPDPNGTGSGTPPNPLAALGRSTPSPTPVPAELPADAARKKLGWLGIDVGPESLLKAAGNKEYYVAELLTTAGVDANATDAEGRTPLLRAIGADDGKMIGFLLERGADANAAGPGQAPPLMVAANAGDAALMDRLLKAGAKVDAADADGRTILFQMVESGKADELAVLLEAGADWQRAGPGGATPLEAALRRNDATIARMLFALETEPRSEWTPFMRERLARALKSGDRDMAGLLLAHHPGIPKPEGATQSLLAYSLAWQDLTTFRTLLDCGADPNEKLTIPAEAKFIEAVNDPELTFYLGKEQGMTLLMLAAGLGRLEFVQELLNRGASKTARTEKYRMVPLNFAERANQTQTILLLMGKNPDPSTHTTRIAISLSDQRAVYYKDGVAVFRTPVSTGRSDYRTPAGDYVITDKQRSRVSSIYEVEMPYFMRLNGSGYGMHEGYVPDYPASHGCIRLPKKAARRLYSEVEVGTYVTISP